MSQIRWDILSRLMASRHPTDPFELVGAEIGVQVGRMTKEVLLRLPSIKKYYAVDPFIFYDDFEQACIDIPEKYRTKIGRNQDGMDVAFDTFLNVTAKFKNKIHLLKMFSEEAAKHIDDDSLDFCFIDGNHLYEYIKRDIELYYPKVKKGGLFGGHDYDMPGTGIKQAVDECFSKDDVLFHQDWTWWVWV